jgi:hypothetical protein
VRVSARSADPFEGFTNQASGFAAKTSFGPLKRAPSAEYKLAIETICRRTNLLVRKVEEVESDESGAWR